MKQSLLHSTDANGCSNVPEELDVIPFFKRRECLSKPLLCCNCEILKKTLAHLKSEPVYFNKLQQNYEL